MLAEILDTLSSLAKACLRARSKSVIFWLKLAFYGGNLKKIAIGAVVGICMRARLIGEKLGPHDSGVFL